MSILLFHSKIETYSMYHTAHAMIEIKNYHNFMQNIVYTKGLTPGIHYIGA